MEYTNNWSVLKDAQMSLEAASNIFMSEVLVNTVIFSFYNNKLDVLLLHIGEGSHYSLPGGYVFKNETIDDALLRILQQ